MNTKKSLSLLPTALNLSGNLVAVDNRGESPLLKQPATKLRQDIANSAPLKVCQGLKGFAKVAGEADVDPLLTRFHVAERGRVVATNPEEKTLIVAKNRKKIADWPQTGHISHMPKAAHPSKGSPYEEKRHRFYMEADEVVLFDKACELNGKSRSEMIARLARSYIRQNIVKLQKAKVKLPAELLTK